METTITQYTFKHNDRISKATLHDDGWTVTTRRQENANIPIYTLIATVDGWHPVLNRTAQVRHFNEILEVYDLLGEQLTS